MIGGGIPKEKQVGKQHVKKINDLFNQVVGGNKDRMLSKYKNMMKTLDNIKSLLKSFKSSIPGLPSSNKSEIEEDINNLIKILDEDVKYFSNITFSDETVEKDRKLFEQFKDCEIIKILTSMSAHLLDYEKAMRSLQTIKNLPGPIWEPYKRIRFNFKTTLNDIKCASYHLKLLTLFYDKTRELHELKNVPEIDVSVLKKAIIKYLDYERKYNQDAKAFDEIFKYIERAVDKFEDRFPDYYAEAVVSGNQAKIIELLIADTADDIVKQQEDVSNPKTVRRMRMIVFKLRKYMNTLIDRIKTSKHADKNVVSQFEQIAESLQAPFDKVENCEDLKLEDFDDDEKFPSLD